MSKSESVSDTVESPAVPETTYYECLPCGYRSPVMVSIPLCPCCGERITETVTY